MATKFYVNEQMYLPSRKIANLWLFLGTILAKVSMWRQLVPYFLETLIFPDPTFILYKILYLSNFAFSYRKLKKDLLPFLTNRHNKYAMKFSYWPDPYMRTDHHIYELRNYNLKPGTMVEWGNYWAKAIRMRDYQDQEAFMGMFSQVGDLYNVKHIWSYDSLQDRQKARDTVWQKQQMQWSEIVTHTMPLIRSMDSRIMAPTDYSPTK